MVHEWALAESIVAAVAKAVGDRAVRSVRVVLGELQNVDAGILSFALEELKKGTSLEAAEVTLEVEPAEFECNACGRRWTLRESQVGEGEREAIHFVPELAHAFMKCPRCGSPDFKVVRGRGVWIESVELG